jgi:hypothetical protein
MAAHMGNPEATLGDVLSPVQLSEFQSTYMPNVPAGTAARMPSAPWAQSGILPVPALFSPAQPLTAEGPPEAKRASAPEARTAQPTLKGHVYGADDACEAKRDQHARLAAGETIDELTKFGRKSILPAAPRNRTRAKAPQAERDLPPAPAITPPAAVKSTVSSGSKSSGFIAPAMSPAQIQATAKTQQEYDAELIARGRALQLREAQVATREREAGMPVFSGMAKATLHPSIRLRFGGNSPSPASLAAREAANVPSPRERSGAQREDQSDSTEKAGQISGETLSDEELPELVSDEDDENYEPSESDCSQLNDVETELLRLLESNMAAPTSSPVLSPASGRACRSCPWHT